MLTDIKTIFQKEFMAYFRSRLGYFIMVVYVLMSTTGTFFGTDFITHTNPSLSQFFLLQNDLFPLIIPAVTMKLWTDEWRQNTMELLLSQPVPLTSMVIGKFLSAWGFSCLLILLESIGLWLVCGWIIEADNWSILANIFACFLMAGALCSICLAVSALNTHAVSSYIVSLLVCALLRSINLDILMQKIGISNEIISRSSQVFNFQQQFMNIISGQLSLSGLFYYLSFMVLSLWFCVAAIEYKRS